MKQSPEHIQKRTESMLRTKASKIPLGKHWCSICKEYRPVELFRKRGKSSKWLTSCCVPCEREKVKHYRSLKPERTKEIQRRNSFRINHGIDQKSYETIMERQGGVCAICKKPPVKKRLFIDHCHKTNVIRGLLCTRCNSAIGLMGDDPALALAALQYLTTATTEFESHSRRGSRGRVTQFSSEMKSISPKP